MLSNFIYYINRCLWSCLPINNPNLKTFIWSFSYKNIPMKLCAHALNINDARIYLINLLDDIKLKKEQLNNPVKYKYEVFNDDYIYNPDEIDNLDYTYNTRLQEYNKDILNINTQLFIGPYTINILDLCDIYCDSGYSLKEVILNEPEIKPFYLTSVFASFV
jgi:hypothetical protein